MSVSPATDDAVVVVADCVEKGVVRQARRRFALLTSNSDAQATEETFEVRERLAYRFEWNGSDGWRIASVTAV